ncbi:hypothetical protein P4233_21640 [Pseudomonas aeruginosa]|nr:hypothetical protein [Pseudomonas aeruginosa]
MKVLYRPHGLHPHAEDAAAELGFALRDETLRVDNPTPYFVSLAGLALEIGETRLDLPGTLLAPRSQRRPRPAAAGGRRDARRGGVRLDRRQRRQPPGKESSTVNGSPQARQHEHPPAVAASWPATCASPGVSRPPWRAVGCAWTGRPYGMPGIRNGSRSTGKPCSGSRPPAASRRCRPRN